MILFLLLAVLAGAMLPVQTGVNVQLRGLLGAAYIAVTVVLAPRLGAASLIAALVAGQMAASLIVDHYGWIGFAQHAVTPLRLAGAGSSWSA
jgi:uncharacterized membrane protein YdcZ (DUF606 family)